MHVGDLAIHNAANEHIAPIADGARQPKDFVSSAVRPPTAANRFTRNGFGEIRDRAPGSFEHDAVLPDEAPGRLQCHGFISLSQCWTRAGIGIVTRERPARVSVTL